MFVQERTYEVLAAFVIGLHGEIPQVKRAPLNLKKKLAARRVEWLVEAPDCCPICYETIEGAVETKCCKKSFHEKCFANWLKRSNTCPTCRSTHW